MDKSDGSRGTGFAIYQLWPSDKNNMSPKNSSTAASQVIIERHLPSRPTYPQEVASPAMASLTLRSIVNRSVSSYLLIEDRGPLPFNPFLIKVIQPPSDPGNGRARAAHLLSPRETA